MNDREADPGQCRVLREADQNFQRGIRQLGDDQRTTRGRIKAFKDDLSDMRSELGRLRAVQIAALGLSASRRAGPVGASVEMRATLDITVLEARIQDKEIRLKGEEMGLTRLKRNFDYQTSELKENAQAMRQLNCVLP